MAGPYEKPSLDQTVIGPVQEGNYLSGGSTPNKRSFLTAFSTFAPPIVQLLNLASQFFTNRSNRQFELEQTKLRNQFAIEQWERENAYNTPSAQMARYVAAGLNPNLAYSQPNLSAASPDIEKASFKATAPTMDNFSMLQGAQLENIEADSALKESQAALNEKKVEATDAEIEKIFQDVAHSKQDVQRIISQIDYFQNNSRYLEKLSRNVELQNQVEEWLQDLEVQNDYNILNPENLEKWPYIPLKLGMAMADYGISREYSLQAAALFSAQIYNLTSSAAYQNALAGISNEDLDRLKRLRDVYDTLVTSQSRSLTANALVDEYSESKKEFNYHFGNVVKAVQTAGDIAGIVISAGTQKAIIKSYSDWNNIRKYEAYTNRANATVNARKNQVSSDYLNQHVKPMR